MDDALVEYYRKEFPVTFHSIYLDHAGVAPLSLRVRTAVENFLNEATEGGAFHYPAWAQRIVETRMACAELIHASPEEIAFVNSTSHGLSIVANGLDWKEGDNLLVYEKEFPSNIYPWLNLQRNGVRIKTIPSRGGKVHLEDIEQIMDGRTRLLAISSVQFANGFRLDLRRLGELCRQRNILLCVDAIQSLGVIPMDVQEYHIDFLSADAHKWLLGPEGIGLFYCRRELCERISPPLVGWKSVQQEFDFDHPRLLLKTDALKFEEGSLNLMGIMGLQAALMLLAEAGMERVTKRILDLGDVIIREAEQQNYAVLTPKNREERGGNITIAGPFDPVVVRDRLRDKRVMVNARGGGLRVSPHFYNTDAELLDFYSELQKIKPRS